MRSNYQNKDTNAIKVPDAVVVDWRNTNSKARCSRHATKEEFNLPTTIPHECN
jgi:hypothetical protein